MQFEMSPHAVERALDMGLEGHEIREAMESADQIYWSQKYEAWTYQKGRVALGVVEKGLTYVVTTVLWARDSDWAADAAIAPLPTGRELRGPAAALARRNR